MLDGRVGAIIVLGARESLVQGAGLEPVGTTCAKVMGVSRDEVPVKADAMQGRLSDECDWQGESPLP